MALKSLESILHNKGLNARDIDLIIVATVTPTWHFRHQPVWYRTKLVPQMPGLSTYRQPVVVFYMR
jgi:3-oxoacyl-[acyl-carrier-protein] synthase III